MGEGVCVEVGEEEARERCEQLDKCLVGWWGKGLAPIPRVDSVRDWAILQWEVKESFAMVRLGRELWLFEFEKTKEADCVLKLVRMRRNLLIIHWCIVSRLVCCGRSYWR